MSLANRVDTEYWFFIVVEVYVGADRNANYDQGPQFMRLTDLYRNPNLYGSS